VQPSLEEAGMHLHFQVCQQQQQQQHCCNTSALAAHTFRNGRRGAAVISGFSNASGG
jgi:hypothetical protein